MNNAVVKILGTQYIDDETVETDFGSMGEYIYNENEAVIKYTEKSDTGANVTFATVTVKDDSVNLERKGESCSNMFFKVGDFSATEYVTLYGTFNMTVITQKLKIDKTKDGAEVEIEYILNVDKLTSAKNNIKISCRKRKVEE